MSGKLTLRSAFQPALGRRAKGGVDREVDFRMLFTYRTKSVKPHHLQCPHLIYVVVSKRYRMERLRSVDSPC
jgi:hypothetical protein